MEAAVGALGGAFAGEHPGRVLGGALEGEHAGGEGVLAGQVLAAEPGGEVLPGAGARERDLGHAVAGEGQVLRRHAQLAPAHLVDELVGGVPRLDLVPAGELAAQGRVDLAQELLVALTQDQHRGVGLGVDQRLRRVFAVDRRHLLAELGEGAGQGLRAAGELGLLGAAAVVRGEGVGDLGEVAAALGGHHGGHLGAAARHLARVPVARVQRVEAGHQPGEEAVDAGVAEAAGRGEEDRHLLERGLEQLVVALVGLGDVALCILGAALVGLVQHHAGGEVEHVDLLELGRRAELRGHHVDRQVNEVGHRRVALANAGGLEHDQVEARGLQQQQRVLHRLRGREVRTAGGHRAHVDPRTARGVHADAVTQQCTAGATAARVH